MRVGPERIPRQRARDARARGRTGDRGSPAARRRTSEATVHLPEQPAPRAAGRAGGICSEQPPVDCRPRARDGGAFRCATPGRRRDDSCVCRAPGRDGGGGRADRLGGVGHLCRERTRALVAGVLPEDVGDGTRARQPREGDVGEPARAAGALLRCADGRAAWAPDFFHRRHRGSGPRTRRGRSVHG